MPAFNAQSIRKETVHWPHQLLRRLVLEGGPGYSLVIGGNSSRGVESDREIKQETDSSRCRHQAYPMNARLAFYMQGLVSVHLYDAAPSHQKGYSVYKGY